MKVTGTYRRPSGWKGHSYEHGLARKGIRTKPKIDPIFYAQKFERDVPFQSIMDDVKTGLTVQEMAMKYPDADPDDLRRRGLKAIEAREGANTLSVLDKNGVDDTVRRAKMDTEFRRSARNALESRQKCSFMHPAKVEALKKRLDELEKS